jgi:hypothetical protein
VKVLAGSVGNRTAEVFNVFTKTTCGIAPGEQGSGDKNKRDKTEKTFHHFCPEK